MRRKIQVPIALLALLLLIACAAKQTPQYQAAVVSNDFAHALGTFQTEEISLYNSGVIPPTGHRQFETVVLKVAQQGKVADIAIGSADWTSGVGVLSSMLTELQGIGPVTLGIKDANSQAIYQASLNTVIAVLQLKLQSAQAQVKP